MKSALVLLLTILVCVSSLFIQRVRARPYENEVSAKERQETLEYLDKLIRNAMAIRNAEVSSYRNNNDKRNSGMMDMVLQLPDMLSVGRK